MKSWKAIALMAALIGAAGMGAAIAPVALAQTRARVAVAPQPDVFSLLGGGSRIGVSIRDIESSDRAKSASGVVIESVDEESPASKAGLRVGDIVVEFDGERVRSVRQFTRLVTETPEGRSVAAAVMRDGQRVTVNVTPESGSRFSWYDGDQWKALDNLRTYRFAPPPPKPPAPPKPGAPPALERFFWSSSANQLGIGAMTLEPQLAEYFGTKEGVLVSSVTSDSAAAKAGLKAGDVITSFNGNPVDSPTDLRTGVRDLDGGEFTLGIVRDKKPMTLKGKLEPPPARRRTTRTGIVL